MKIEITLERTAREALAILVDVASEMLTTLRAQNALLSALRDRLPQPEDTITFDPDETIRLPVRRDQ